MHRQLLASLGIILTALPASSQAQGPGGPQAAFQTLKDSQWVRVTAPGVGRRQGRLLERSPSELVLSTEPQPIRVPATSIDTLWTRGSSAKRGALVGGVIGVVLGAGLGALAAGASDDPQFNGGEAVVGGMGFGGVAGVLLGAFVGLAIPRWHRQYP